MLSSKETMLRYIAVPLLLLSFTFSAKAQDECPPDGDQAADATAKFLQAAPDCKTAAERMRKCRWGSNADSEFAPIVMQKCEATFVPKLSAAGKKHYAEEERLCSWEYSRQEGSLFISEAVVCQTDLAEKYSANPALAEAPMPSASFDCTKASSAMERAICSDKHLGKADIVLNRVYKRSLSFLNAEQKDKLKAAQRTWLQSVPKVCSIQNPPFSSASINCAVEAFSARFTDLYGCSAGETDACLENLGSRVGEDEDDVRHYDRQASFDCTKAKSPMETAICSDVLLGQNDIVLSVAFKDALKAAGSGKEAVVRSSQRSWLQWVAKTCPMATPGEIPSLLTRACLRTAFDTRTEQLRNCTPANAEDPAACLNAFAILGD